MSVTPSSPAQNDENLWPCTPAQLTLGSIQDADTLLNEPLRPATA
jgi:hypothetical protein